jgi:ADP-ribose pyrophosphatase YjhB (NUDIX family)
VAAYAVIVRDERILLSRLADRISRDELWTLPGGGLDHGEAPAAALVREVEEECGVTPDVGELLLVHDEHFSGTAPSGRYEDFHAVALVFAATVPDDAVPRVVEVDGTTDTVAWVPVAELTDGSHHVLDVVHEALNAAD